MTKTIIGTAYFTCRTAAVKYYKDYGFTEEQVGNKISDKEIYIGKPQIIPGDNLRVVPGEGRYMIERTI